MLCNPSPIDGIKGCCNHETFHTARNHGALTVYCAKFKHHYKYFQTVVESRFDSFAHFLK